MTTNTKPVLLLDEALDDRVNRLLDKLGDILRTQDREMQEWAVETLAGALGVAVHIDPADPLTRVDYYADLWLTALSTAGWNRKARDKVMELATRKLIELQEIALVWQEDGRA